MSGVNPNCTIILSRLRVRPSCRWYRPSVRKSPILPLAAAVTAVALSASPAQGSPLAPGKRGEANVVAVPLLAVKGQAPAGADSHVSHSSHVSGSDGHVSHVSHASHVSSVPAPAPTTAAPVATQAPAAPAPLPSTSPSPTAQASTGGSPAFAPPSGAIPSSVVGSGSQTATTNGSKGCAFIVVAPFAALVGWIRRLGRHGKRR
jgi:hypothetical protein